MFSDAKSSGSPKRLFLTASVTNSSISLPRWDDIPCAIEADAAPGDQRLVPRASFISTAPTFVPSVETFETLVCVPDDVGRATAPDVEPPG